MADGVIPIDPAERERRKDERFKAIRSNQITQPQKRARVLELRAAGLTEEQIAQQMGMTQQGVSTMIHNALKKWAKQQGEDVERVRQMRLFELDQLKRAVWADALKGNLKAVREAVRIIQAQAKISGVEAPTQVEHRGNIDIGVDRLEVDRLEKVWLESQGDEVVDGTAKELPAGG